MQFSLDLLMISDNVTGIANVHVMEIPLYEILQQNFVTVLQEREQFFRSDT